MPASHWIGSIKNAQVSRRNRLLQRVGVAERHRHEARSEGTESITIERLGGETSNGSRPAVKIVLADDDLCLTGRGCPLRV